MGRDQAKRCTETGNHPWILAGAILLVSGCGVAVAPNDADPDAAPGSDAPSDQHAVDNERIVQVVGGAGHSCVRTAGGTVRCWGSNNFGELGNGTTRASLSANAVIGLAVTTELTSYFLHSCARLSDNTVSCWGRNQIVGSPGGDVSLVPVSTPGLVDARSIAAGGRFSCAVVAGGSVRCSGENQSGQLGDGSYTASATPVLVAGMSNAAQVVAGEGHACARLLDGTVHCWGAGHLNQLGNPSAPVISSPLPVAVTGITGALDIVAGGNHTCARLSDGTVRCWGANAEGQLGNGTTETPRAVVVVTSLSGAEQLTAGHEHTCARVTSGSAVCWGRNTEGQLGTGTMSGSTTPTRVVGLTDLVDVASGFRHTCGRLADGTLRCWGENAGGQLGDGSTTNRPTPTRVTALGM